MNTSLTERFKEFIRTEDLFKNKEQLLVAVSGGVDSVVLSDLCFKCGFSFSIAHCNFKLRSEESEGDAAFVRSLAHSFDVNFFEKEFDTGSYASVNKLSIQAAAREIRYNWFETLIDPFTGLPFRYILTAHHADDNVETILMNFFKGTGINGLKGIMPVKEKLVRPLLFARKSEILIYAEENKLNYREDSSNISDKYTRNYFRNELIPAIEKVFPSVMDNLSANAEKFREIHLIFKKAVENIISKLCVTEGESIHVPVLKLLKTPALQTIVFEIIKKYNYTSAQVPEVIRLLSSGSGKFIVSPTHRLLHNRKWLIISPLKNESISHFVIEEDTRKIFYDEFEIKIETRKMPVSIIQDTNVAQLDLSTVTFPLLLRKRKEGDYFYPLGMTKKKKLSRFFIDQKLSLNEKENIWVIESNKKIIWIVGHRIDNRFKLKTSTALLLEINRLPAKNTRM
ncbi:MAG: tRNA lysidine(34) synthetase TilS [Ferruginibacter sp.]